MIRGCGREIPGAVRAAIEDVKKALPGVYVGDLVAVYLYGSYARGDFDENSDIDLAVVLKGRVSPCREINRLGETLSDIALRHDVLISIYPISQEMLQDRKGPLFENIRREGVKL